MANKRIYESKLDKLRAKAETENERLKENAIVVLDEQLTLCYGCGKYLVAGGKWLNNAYFFTPDSGPNAEVKRPGADVYVYGVVWAWCSDCIGPNWIKELTDD